MAVTSAHHCRTLTKGWRPYPHRIQPGFLETLLSHRVLIRVMRSTVSQRGSPE